MKKLRVYLDTSVVNFLYADDAPERRDITRRLFRAYFALGYYQVFVSSVVINEIQRTRDSNRRALLMSATSKPGLHRLEMAQYSDSVQVLAQAYLAAKIIPPKKVDDALHVALATVTEMDILLSWNYEHLANVNKEARILLINQRLGYTKPLRMLTPAELVHEKD